MIQQHIKVCHFQLVQESENMMDTLQLKHATRLSGVDAYMWAKSFVNESPGFAPGSVVCDLITDCFGTDAFPKC